MKEGMEGRKKGGKEKRKNDEKGKLCKRMKWAHEGVKDSEGREDKVKFSCKSN